MRRACKSTFFYIALAILLFSPAAARSNDTPNVLILHSYVLTSSWTQEIMNGMMSVLNAADMDLNVYTEQLDAMRISKDKSWPAFEEYLKNKYHGMKFNVILGGVVTRLPRV